MRCPNCSCEVAFAKDLFRGRHCKACGATMLVSATYIRVLIVLSFLVAEILLWVANIRFLFYPTLGIVFGFLATASLGYPLGFLILTVLVRTVPRVVEPKLVPRRFGSLTALGLSANQEVTQRDGRESE